MRYVTSIERRAEARGLEKGVEQGIEQGLKAAREAVLEILALRFAVIPAELTQYINAITTLAHLKTLLRHAALSSSIEEFEHLATAETDRP